MKARIESITSIDEDLETYAPDDPRIFWIGLTICVGTEDAPGCDLFYLTVTTPEYLQQTEGDRLNMWAHGVFLTSTYNWRKIKAEIEREFLAYEADSWRELAIKLSRIAQWEYAGLHDLPQSNS